MKVKKLIEEGYSEVSDKIGQSKMIATDGKLRLTDCANTETMFRIVQSIPIEDEVNYYLRRFNRQKRNLIRKVKKHGSQI